jgi:hypothetical protein
MRIIDEKPKHGHEKVKQRPMQRMLGVVFVISCVIFLVLSFAYMGVCLIVTDCGYNGPSSLELIATDIVRQNMTTEANLTFLPDIDIPNVYDLQIATAESRFEHATSISYWQTRLAATQDALATQQAQIIPTLTAVVTRTP